MKRTFNGKSRQLRVVRRKSRINLVIVIINSLRRLAQRIRRSDILVVLLITAVLVTVSTIFYVRVEGWTVLDALYQTVITMTTIGYGDLSPQTRAGRIFAIFFSFFAIGIAGYAISAFAASLIENREEKRNKILRKRRMKRIDTLNNHYIVCGAELLGLRIAEELQLANAPYIIIDEDEEKLRYALLHAHPEYFKQKVRSLIDIVEVDLSEYEEKTLPEIAELLDTAYILASPTEEFALKNAGIDRAKGLIATMQDERDNLSIVVGAKALAQRLGNEDLKIMASVEDTNFMRKLILAGADYVRIPAVSTGLEMAMHMMNPEIAEWWYSLMGVNRSDAPRMAQSAVSDNPTWLGKTVAQLHAEKNIVTAALKRDGEFHSPPPANMVLESADILIALTPPPQN